MRMKLKIGIGYKLIVNFVPGSPFLVGILLVFKITKILLKITLVPVVRIKRK